MHLLEGLGIVRLLLCLLEDYSDLEKASLIRYTYNIKKRHAETISLIGAVEEQHKGVA